MNIFSRKVLTCVKDQKRTLEEIRGHYLKLYPQGMIAKVLVLPVTSEKIKIALLSLVSGGYVYKEVTNFIEKPLRKETEIFWISNKGRKYLLPKK
jgi:hypothetical protein